MSTPNDDNLTMENYFFIAKHVDNVYQNIMVRIIIVIITPYKNKIW